MIPKIFVFSGTGLSHAPGTCYAMAEDGTVLATHYCTNESFAASDLGATPGHRSDLHVIYAEHYPEIYEVEFVPSYIMTSHSEFQKAIKLNFEQTHSQLVPARLVSNTQVKKLSQPPEVKVLVLNTVSGPVKYHACCPKEYDEADCHDRLMWGNQTFVARPTPPPLGTPEIVFNLLQQANLPESLDIQFPVPSLATTKSGDQVISLMNDSLPGTSHFISKGLTVLNSYGFGYFLENDTLSDIPYTIRAWNTDLSKDHQSTHRTLALAVASALGHMFAP